MKHNKLTVSSEGVFLNETEIKNCTAIDIKNLNPKTPFEVAIHIDVVDVEIKYDAKV